MKQITGSCHCENIRFELDWPQDTNVIATRECGCSLCQKHGGSWTSNTDATLRASISMPAEVTEYKFGTKTAVFYVCKSCGAVPFVTSAIDDRLYAVINTNTFDNRADMSFSASATSFDGEELQDRIARRKQNWINQVEFVTTNS